MANRLYQTFKQALLTGAALDLTDGNVKAVLIDTDAHTPDTTIAGDEFLADIAAGARVSVTGALANPTVVDGVFDADDVPLPDAGGAVSEAVAVFYDSGVEGTSRLIALIDTATGLPLTPDSVEDTIVWPAGGIFAL